MRAFVTGGTGFVGSHLVEEVLGRGYEVRCLVRSDPKWLDGLPIDRLAADVERANETVLRPRRDCVCDLGIVQPERGQ